MALRIVFGWIGVSVGGLLLLAVVDGARALIQRFARMRARRLRRASVASEVGSSPTRAR